MEILFTSGLTCNAPAYNDPLRNAKGISNNMRCLFFFDKHNGSFYIHPSFLRASGAIIAGFH